MGLVIKMKREGSIRNTSYSIVVMNQKTNIKGRYLASIGNISLEKYPSNALSIIVDRKLLAIWLVKGAKIKGRLRKYL